MKEGVILNQVKRDLHLTKGKREIILGSHARERIAERLSWSKNEYKRAISETCLEFWDDIIDEDTKWFQIIHKGVKWIFETRGSNRVVLMTVIPCDTPRGIENDLKPRGFCLVIQTFFFLLH
jgi:hypothetical protein